MHYHFSIIFNLIIKAIFIFSLVGPIFISCTKTVQNQKDNDDDLFTPEEGYSNIDLTHSLSEMNDATEIMKNIKKEPARPDDSVNYYIHTKLESIRYEYNKRMHDIGSFNASIRFEFKIISSGEVVSIRTLSSTINDTTFIDNLKKRILIWNFGKIDIENDTTTVIYPFIFNFQ